jgi:hypothetical protein
MKGRFWVDANVFIWGEREPFPMPGAMPYWNWFEKMVDAGRITSHKCAIKEVLDGEKKGQPERIVTWVKTRQAKLADNTPDSKECQELIGKLCLFSYEKFGSAKTVEFTKGADMFLIARAFLDDGTLVTQESDKKMVRIPTVCDKFNVPHMTLFQMNKALKMKL